MHRQAGVSLRLGTGVRELVGDGHVEAATLDDGTTQAADLVVVALGVTPATSWLDGSDITVRDGVVCDAYLRTGIEGVYAAGDVARVVDPLTGRDERDEHWTAAADQADVVAHNLLAADGELKRYAVVPYVWSDQHGRKVQTLGRPAAGDTEKVIAHDTAGGTMLSVFGRKGMLCGVAGISMAGRLMRLRGLLTTATSLDEAVQATT